MDRETGEPLLNADGSAVTAEATFTAESEDGTANVTFTFDASKLGGKSIVVFEYLMFGTEIIASHEDIENENQTVHFPEIGTTAENEQGTHISKAAEDISITDTVTYRNLIPGLEYDVSGVLMDKATGETLLDDNGAEIVSTATFTPETADGTIEITFNFSGVTMEGKTAVAFETVSYDNREVAVHTDIDDEAQSIHIPKIHTSAVSDAGSQMVKAGEEMTIIDTVTYENLIPGVEYTIHGILMDKATGAALLDDNKQEIKTSKTFTPDSANGSVDVAFKFAGISMKGVTTVVFESLTYQDTEIATHEDIHDAGQTICVPNIQTTALSDKDTHFAQAADEIVVHDTVAYTNLMPGKEYTVKGVLMDKHTGEALLDDNGSKITAESTFVAEESNGSVVVTFKFSGVKLGGKAAVAFEDLFYGDQEVAIHADIDDAEQTVYIPEIKTEALSEKDMHIVKATEDITISDTVSYKGLIPGLEYTVTGALMDQSTGEAILDDLGNRITSRTVFTPDASDGAVTVTFKFPGVTLAGKTVVAFENLFYDEQQIAVHADIHDASQTIQLPKIHTTAVSDAGTKLVEATEKMTIIDTVEYENLIPGEKYVMNGKLMDQSTGEALLDDNENEINASTAFTAAEANGTVDVTFEFPGVNTKNITTVAFESLTYQGVEIAAHADIHDANQTVCIPEIHTTAASKAGTHIVEATKDITVVDTVVYANLIAGKEYTVRGTLMNKATGEAMLDDSGKEITAETTFVAETPNGSVDVTFVFSGVTLAGKTMVAFEQMFMESQIVATHADIEDEDQTIYIPKIGTTLTDEDGKKTVDPMEEVKLVDEVSYSNLIPGKAYVISGVLMSKNTGDALRNADGTPIVVEQEFVPETADGKISVSFAFNASALRGQTVVAFEQITLDGVAVATHADFEDEGQSVVVNGPAIKTEATVDGEHKFTAKGNVTLTDVVSYEGLVPGHEYTIFGVLMDKGTGKAVLDRSGREITASVVLIPKEPSGSVEVKFHFDATMMGGMTLVVFERIMRDDTELATHADINDAAQSVSVEAVEHTPETGDSGIGRHLLMGCTSTVMIAGIGIYLMSCKRPKGKRESHE